MMMIKYSLHIKLRLKRRLFLLILATRLRPLLILVNLIKKQIISISVDSGPLDFMLRTHQLPVVPSGYNSHD